MTKEAPQESNPYEHLNKYMKAFNEMYAKYSVFDISSSEDDEKESLADKLSREIAEERMRNEQLQREKEQQNQPNSDQIQQNQGSEKD